MRLIARGMLILFGAVVTGVAASVLSYVGFSLVDTCVAEARRVCEPWPAMGFGIFVGTIATPVGGALTYWWTRPAEPRINARDA